MLQGRESCRAGLAATTTFMACHVCGQRFHGVYQKYNLKRHKAIHTGEKPYLCPRCPTAFNQKCNMKRHLESVHGVKIPSQHKMTPPQDASQDTACSNQQMIASVSQQMITAGDLHVASSDSNQMSFTGSSQWSTQGATNDPSPMPGASHPKGMPDPDNQTTVHMNLGQ